MLGGGGCPDLGDSGSEQKLSESPPLVIVILHILHPLLLQNSMSEYNSLNITFIRMCKNPKHVEVSFIKTQTVFLPSASPSGVSHSLVHIRNHSFTGLYTRHSKF